MKNKIIFLTTLLVVGLLIYNFVPFGDKETQIVPSQELINPNNLELTNAETTQTDKTLIKIQKPDLKTDLEKIWYKNDFTDNSVSSYMDELFLAVDNGNPIAKYHLAYIHRECLNVPQNKERLYLELSGIKSDGGQQYWLDLYNFCDGYPRDKITQEDVINYTMAAARAGHPLAKFEFQAVAFMGMSPDTVLENAELIVELKNESFQHLLDTRTMGHKSSLMYLGMAYQDGALIEQNYIEAYAHYYAHNEVNANADGTLLDMIGHQLTNEEIEIAIRKGERYARCCK